MATPTSAEALRCGGPSGGSKKAELTLALGKEASACDRVSATRERLLLRNNFRTARGPRLAELRYTRATEPSRACAAKSTAHADRSQI